MPIDPEGKSGSPRRDRGGFQVSGTMSGVIMCLAGACLAVLLWTYEGKIDLEGKLLEHSDFFGWPGAWGAYGLFVVLGFASWLLPILFIWWGCFQVKNKGELPGRILWAGAIMLICVAGIAGSQQVVALKWSNELGLSGPGGLLGYVLGEKALIPYLGRSGTVAALTVLYSIALVYVTGMKMWPFLKAVWKSYRSWREERSENEAWSPDNIRGGSLADRLDRRQKDDLEPEPEEEIPASRKPRKQERKPLNQQVELPLPVRPEPRIIDVSQTKIVKTVERPVIQAEKEPEPENPYTLPPLDILHEPPPSSMQTQADKDELMETQDKIVETLRSFGIDVAPGNITRGPTITRYEIYPSTGLRVSKITSLSADIARATKAERINILAPIPGRDTVGIEIANNKKVAVPLRELLDDPLFKDTKKKIPLALGKDVYGNVVVGDLAAMPHLLVAGATGSGKSVCINSIISSILFRFRPEELKFILVDPKVVEMQSYAKLPHLIVPVVTEPKKVLGALRWAVNEMERRYRIFADAGVRNFDGYNNRPRPEKTEEKKAPSVPAGEEDEEDPEFIESLAASIEGTGYEPAPRNERGGTNSSYFDELEAEDEEEDIPDTFPYIVIIIDELADLMQTARADIETYISRLTAKARAAGIHLIVATQTPRSDVVTGVIKANIPCRIAFQVSSGLDSRIILDSSGAENLVGKGDLYYLPPGSAKLERAQGAYISDDEVEKLVEHCAQQASPRFEKEVQTHMEEEGMDSGDDPNELSKSDEEDLLRCMEVIRADQKASVSLLQRRLKFGYNKAARLMDMLEARGVVGPSEGPTKSREVYIK